MNLDSLTHKVNVEGVQKIVDKKVREELEKFHDYKILPCGMIFSHTAEELSYEMIKDYLIQNINDQSVTIQRIEISEARLFARDDEGDRPITFVKVWYYASIVGLNL